MSKTVEAEKATLKQKVRAIYDEDTSRKADDIAEILKTKEEYPEEKEPVYANLGKSVGMLLSWYLRELNPKSESEGKPKKKVTKAAAPSHAGGTTGVGEEGKTKQLEAEVKRLQTELDLCKAEVARLKRMLQMFIS